MKISIILAAVGTLGGLLPARSDAAINLDFVTVGDAGNPNDSTGFGAVSQSYNIGKYEVTLLQYTAFLNAVAATDTYDLWSSGMQDDQFVAGISRAGSVGNFSYSVIGDGNRPVTYVSWFDAARFTNWLHNGQPIGAQVAGTTETGAYALNGATSGGGFARSVNSAYWIPSEDEWYKAAYYQPAAAGGDTDGYWLYPMQTNGVPFSDEPPGATPDNTRVGNFFRDDGAANGYNDGYAVFTGGNVLTAVGAYSASDSYYGTFDQGGNVGEWNDADLLGLSRGVRGGSWFSLESVLQASNRNFTDPTVEDVDVGFRVATIPEPAVGVNLIIATGWLLSRRRKPAIL